MSKNILEPKTINIDGDNITLYTARFNGLYDLYDYLKSNPKINTKAFNNDSSLKSFDFKFSNASS